MYFCLLALVVLWFGYKYFGHRLEKLFGANIHNIPVDYEQGKNNELRFLDYRQAQLAQMGIITSVQVFFGAILGIFYGPMQIAWIVCGAIFLGATMSYFAGNYALHHNGQTLLRGIKKRYPNFYLLLLSFVLMTVMSGIAGAFSFIFHINYIAQGFSPIIYIYFAMILFIGLCVRQYFNFCAMLIGGIFVAVTCSFLLVSINLLPNVNISLDMAVYPQFNYSYPLLFFVVSSGVLSGTGILSGTLLAPSLKNEKMAKGVYFGASLFLAAAIIVWVMIFIAHNPDVTLLAKQLYKFNHPYEFIDKVFLQHFNWLGYCVFYIAIIAASIGSGGMLLRLARQLITETGFFSESKNKMLTVAIFVLAYIAYVFSFGFKVFDICNMFIATMCLFAFILYLREKHKKTVLYDFVSFFLLGICLAQMLFVFFNQTINVAAICGITLTLVLCLGWSIYLRWHRK